MIHTSKSSVEEEFCLNIWFKAYSSVAYVALLALITARAWSCTFVPWGTSHGIFTAIWNFLVFVAAILLLTVIRLHVMTVRPVPFEVVLDGKMLGVGVTHVIVALVWRYTYLYFGYAREDQVPLDIHEEHEVVGRDVFIDVAAILTGIYAAVCFVYYHEYVVIFPPIAQHPSLALRTQLPSLFLIAFKRAAYVSVATLLLRIFWNDSILRYYSKLFGTTHRSLAGEGPQLFSTVAIGFHVFPFSLMISLLMIVSRFVMVQCLSQPQRMDITGLLLPALASSEEGGVEASFLLYSPTKSVKGESHDCYVPETPTRSLHFHRFETVMSAHANDSIGHIPHRVRIDRQILRAHAIYTLWAISKFDVELRMEVFREWREVVRCCTSKIDTITVQLQLGVAASPPRDSKSSDSRQILWLADKLMKVHCDVPLTLKTLRSYPASQLLQRFKKIIGWTPPMGAFAFADIQSVSWSIEALAAFCVASISEDRKGVVQQTLPMVLDSILACKLAVQHYICANTSLFTKGTRSTVVAQNLECVLDRSMYAISTVFFEHLGEFAFCPTYATKLKQYVNFEV